MCIMISLVSEGTMQLAFVVCNMENSLASQVKFLRLVHMYVVLSVTQQPSHPFNWTPVVVLVTVVLCFPFSLLFLFAGSGFSAEYGNTLCK